MTHPTFPGDFCQPGDSGHEYPDEPTPYDDLVKENAALRGENERFRAALDNAIADASFCLRYTNDPRIISRLEATVRNIKRRLQRSVPSHEA